LLHDSLKDIYKTNPTWETQEYITLRIPTNNLFNKNSCEKIEEEVRDFYTSLRIKKSIGDILSPELPKDTLKSYRDRSPSYAMENVAPALKDAGIIDIIDEKIETLSKSDQKLSRTLSEASTFLQTFNDIEALKILENLEVEFENASDSIKARYFNSKGVLALHLKNEEEYLKWFEKAYELRPKESKIATNYLLVKFHFFVKKEQLELPEEFSSKLEDVILNNPEFWPALRLKAYFLAEVSSIEEAHKYLEISSALKKNPLPSHICLAEIYKNAGKIDGAIEVLKQIESKGIVPDESFYSLYAFLLFAKAIGGISANGHITIYGAGPPNLNIELLKRALDYYERAYKKFVSKGFPAIYEDSIVNYATVLELLGDHKKAETISRAYLDIHPECIYVNGSLATNLFKQGKYPQSLKYGIKTFSGDPSSTAFVNLILTLYAAEEHDKLLMTVSERLESAFHNKMEEGIARAFAAMSYKELGLLEKAEKQISILENDEDLKIDAIIAKASIVDESEKAADIYRSGLSDYPNELRLLSLLLAELLPVKEETADEVINILQNIKQMQQLIPREYYGLSRAYLIINKPEDAEKIIREGTIRYPHEYRLLFEHAIVLYRLGYEDESYKELNLYLKEGKRDYTVLKNMAVAAKDTGRIDDAIKLLSSSLKKTADKAEQGIIHCQLYDLKRRMEYPPKELLRHIVEYGKTSKSDPELEARYLMLFMMAPDIPKFEKDEEVNHWVKEFNERLNEFTEKYPNFPALRRFSLLGGVPDKEKAKDILSTIAYLSLPHDLATASAKIETRTGEWPIYFRSRYLYSLSIYDYWSQCIKSKESQHGIYIWRPFNVLDEEQQVIHNSKITCVDIVALLTLAELEILDALNVFEQIYISWGTKISLEKELFGNKSPHPLAKKLHDWRIRNRSKIRIRSDIPEEEEESNVIGYQKTDGGLFLKREEPINRTIDDGIGETLLLAQKLKLPLFSDESFIRNIAKNNYGVKTFSTLGLLNHLKDKGYLSISQVTQLLSQMIEKNFFIIPFTAEHLHGRLKEMLSVARSSGRNYLKSDELRSDHILMPILKQFGEQSLYHQVVRIAVEWWLLLIDDPDVSHKLLVECISYISFILSMRTMSAVIEKRIYKDEQQERMASILALFLLRAYLKNKRLTIKAWSAIKTCFEIYFAERSEAVLFKYLPKWLKNILEREKTLTDDEKRKALFEIPDFLIPNEKEMLISYFLKNKPKFMK
jgi:pentatricopeptide repeat protein